MSLPKTAEDFPIHPLAAIFPLMDDARFAELCDSIKKGFDPTEPIVLHRDESTGALKILDGVNRQRACKQVGVTPRYIGFEDLPGQTSAAAYVWRKNGVRRDLTPHQRAAIIVRLEEERGRIAADAEQRKVAGRERGLQVIAGKRGESTLEMNSSPRSGRTKTRTELAKKARVSEHQIQQAVAVQKESPELLEQVAKGGITLPAAVKRVSKKKPEEKLNNPLLWRHCENQIISVPEAIMLAGLQARFNQRELSLLVEGREDTRTEFEYLTDDLYINVDMLRVLEKTKACTELPEDRLKELLAKCDVAAITLEQFIADMVPLICKNTEDCREFLSNHAKAEDALHAQRKKETKHG